MADWFDDMFGSNDVEHQLITNPTTLAALRGAGSDLSKPHDIEHHIYCRDDQACQELSAAGRGLGYEAGNQGSGETDEGHEFLYFDLIKPTVPEQQSLDSDVRALVDLATKHQAFYDGWGTLVVE